ncbi:MAG: hypothetical protein JWQ88_2915 [Rhodoferax sp.]|nr:hypothetical protein [Rhodoferax sp.]
MKIFGMLLLGVILGGQWGESRGHGPGFFGGLINLLQGVTVGGRFGLVVGIVWHFGQSGADAPKPESGVGAARLEDGRGTPDYTFLVPQTGEWTASLDKGHPQEPAFSSCERSFSLRKHDLFPHPGTMMADVDALSVRWEMEGSDSLGWQMP